MDSVGHQTGLRAVHVLVVDDDPETLRSLSEVLVKQGYKVTAAASAEAALEAARQQYFDLVLCDLNVEGANGMHFARAASRIHPQLPIVVMAAWGDLEASRCAFEAGASEVVTKPLDFSGLPYALENCLQRKRIEIRRLSGERAEILFKAIKALSACIDARSGYTGKHSARLAQFCLGVGCRLNLPAEQLNTLELAAYIHDMGKISTPDSVLANPGKLNDDEWGDMLKHPSLGAEFLEGIDELSEVAAVIRHHHERMDGTGYPDGLAGEAIPLLARILAVVDAFEAMTSDRPYRAAVSWEDALLELKQNAGTQFDPAVVDAAWQVVASYLPDEREQKAA
jgi:putative two-component system response regulator